MKWLLVNSNSRHEIYELWNRDQKILTINYHSEKGSLRINANEEKRALLIAKEGFLRSRLVLRNEYGIRMGQIYEDPNEQLRGEVEVYDEPFSYVIQNGSPRKAAIFKNSDMVVSCELPPSDRNDDLLILTLCWHIASPVTTTLVQYA